MYLGSLAWISCNVELGILSADSSTGITVITTTIKRRVASADGVGGRRRWEALD